MDHKRIYLQPECCAEPCLGRLWCEDHIECDDSECPNGNPDSTEYLNSEWIRSQAAIELDSWKGDNRSSAERAINDLLDRLGLLNNQQTEGTKHDGNC